MIETVVHLANSHTTENNLQNVGHLSVLEAQAALRRQSGNIWNSVLDAIQQRQSAVRHQSRHSIFSWFGRAVMKAYDRGLNY